MKHRASETPVHRAGTSSGPLLLDVRGRDEFASGHLPFAVNIPVQELTQRLSELTPERPVAVYCRSGRRSALATALLRDAGFTQVQDLGGLDQRS